MKPNPTPPESLPSIGGTFDITKISRDHHHVLIVIEPTLEKCPCGDEACKAYKHKSGMSLMFDVDKLTREGFDHQTIHNMGHDMLRLLYIMTADLERSLAAMIVSKHPAVQPDTDPGTLIKGAQIFVTSAKCDAAMHLVTNGGINGQLVIRDGDGSGDPQVHPDNDKHDEQKDAGGGRPGHHDEGGWNNN